MNSAETLGRAVAGAWPRKPLNVTNLMDEEYVSTMGTNGFGTGTDAQTLMVGSPRQVFATVRKSF